MESLNLFVRKYVLLIIAIVVVVILAGAYELGFRVGPGVTISHVGTLTLTNLPKNATLFTDQSPRGTSSGGSMTVDLVPGNHMVILGTPNDFPWSALVNITSGHNTQIDPLLVATTSKITSLTGDSAVAAQKALASSTLPTQAAPLRLAGGCALVYVANNQVIADATTTAGCTPPPYLCVSGKCASTIIYAPSKPLTAVLSYPGRQDALLVGFGNSLYALALDPRSPQFFAPVLDSAYPPKFAELSDGTVVVDNGKSLISLVP